jgi:hypothetical protein
MLTYTHSLQPTILNNNVSQFKVGLETDNGHFTLKVKTVMFDVQLFFAPNSTLHFLCNRKFVQYIHINNSEIGFRGLFYVPVVLVSRGIAQKHFFDKKIQILSATQCALLFRTSC